MLYDLCCPAGVFLPVLLPAAVIVVDLYILIPCRLPDTGKREAPFLCLIGRIFLNDDRIIHDNIQDAHVDNDDALFDADHVRSHADAVILIGTQGIHQVLPDG